MTSDDESDASSHEDDANAPDGVLELDGMRLDPTSGEVTLHANIDGHTFETTGYIPHLLRWERPETRDAERVPLDSSHDMVAQLNDAATRYIEDVTSFDRDEIELLEVTNETVAFEWLSDDERGASDD